MHPRTGADVRIQRFQGGKSSGGLWILSICIIERKNSVTYKEARVYLDEVSKYGSVLGLDTIRGLLLELGNPQDGLKFIHIAGTNGKGSVLAFTSAILREAGYRTGSYISPTVVSYLERIQIDGEWIPKEEFAGYVEEVKKAVARMETKGMAHPTVFEIETAIAFLYFREKMCDYVVLEAGLGGRLDATNVVENTAAAVFATISFDHMGFLGDTLERIAEDKAGIIKPGCVAVSAAQEPEAADILRKQAESLGCQIVFARPEEMRVYREDYRGMTIVYPSWGDTPVETLMAGSYQVFNAAVVFELMKLLKVPKEAVARGFLKARWPGRFTCISEKPLFIVDGAHNRDAAKRMRESVERYLCGKYLIFIMGVFQDKEYEEIAAQMAPLAKSIYTVELPDKGRSLKASELKKVCGPYCGKDVQASGSIREAAECAWQEALAKPGSAVLAFGSLSYLGEVMREVTRLKESMAKGEEQAQESKPGEECPAIDRESRKLTKAGEV